MTCDDCIRVFYPGLAPGSYCYRIPSIIKTSRGTLLAFAEDRGISCGDDGPNHKLVLRRSEDDGETWGPVIIVKRGEVPCEGCAAAISNPNPVEVSFPDGTRALLLHYDTLNNPRPDAHGLDMQLWSGDDGLTWTPDRASVAPSEEDDSLQRGDQAAAAHGLLAGPAPEVLAFRNGRTNEGAMVGPAIGLQDDEGTISFSAHVATSYWGTTAAWHSAAPAPSIVDQVAARATSHAPLQAPAHCVSARRTTQD